MEFWTNLPFTLSLPMMFLLLWVFQKPEEAFVPGARRLVAGGVMLFYVFCVFSPKLAGQPLFFCALWNAWGIFYGIFMRRPIRGLLGTGTQKYWAVYVAVFLLLWFQEVFVALDDKPGQFISHMVHFLGWYVALTLVIVLLKPLFCSVRQVFTIGGVWGIFIEQRHLGIELLHGALQRDALIPHWQELWSFVAFASFIFGVYGFYLAGPALLFHEEYCRPPREHKPWKSLTLFFATWIVVVLATSLWGYLLRLLGIA